MKNIPMAEASVPLGSVDEDSPGSHRAPFQNASVEKSRDLTVPIYLEETYWWAYLHPKGIKFFERQWLVNLILWGNFAKLRDAALAEMGNSVTGRILQVACVYGDFTPKMAQRLSGEGRLDVVDVATVQLENLKRKIKDLPNVHLHHQDSTHMEFADGTFDDVVVFFLLHEQPAGARAKTVEEAIRVTRPGGRVIFVDYHRPHWASPFRYIMLPILSTLEPFALDMWRKEITEWIPKSIGLKQVHKETFFGGLYQKVIITR